MVVVNTTGRLEAEDVVEGEPAWSEAVNVSHTIGVNTAIVMVVEVRLFQKMIGSVNYADPHVAKRFVINKRKGVGVIGRDHFGKQCRSVITVALAIELQHPSAIFPRITAIGQTPS